MKKFENQKNRELPYQHGEEDKECKNPEFRGDHSTIVIILHSPPLPPPPEPPPQPKPQAYPKFSLSAFLLEFMKESKTAIRWLVGFFLIKLLLEHPELIKPITELFKKMPGG